MSKGSALALFVATPIQADVAFELDQWIVMVMTLESSGHAALDGAENDEKVGPEGGGFVVVVVAVVVVVVALALTDALGEALGLDEAVGDSVAATPGLAPACASLVPGFLSSIAASRIATTRSRAAMAISTTRMVRSGEVRFGVVPSGVASGAAFMSPPRSCAGAILRTDARRR